MEESQYLLWFKRKQILNSHIQQPFGARNNNTNSSWEERAFAEDAARILGGCIWPPRSYSCNFCKREFRSAQALGGHMNVHRRDRARLKQSLSHHSESLQHLHKNDCKSPSAQFSQEMELLSSRYCCLDPYIITLTFQVQLQQAKSCLLGPQLYPLKKIVIIRLPCLLTLLQLAGDITTWGLLIQNQKGLQ